MLTNLSNLSVAMMEELDKLEYVRQLLSSRRFYKSTALTSSSSVGMAKWIAQAEVEIPKFGIIA